MAAAGQAPEEPLRLPEILDLAAAPPLAEAMLERLSSGARLELDAAGVVHLGAPCLQVLLAGIAAGARVRGPSPAFQAALALLGAPEAGAAVPTAPTGPIREGEGCAR